VGAGGGLGVGEGPISVGCAIGVAVGPNIGILVVGNDEPPTDGAAVGSRAGAAGHVSGKASLTVA
jgi:hypothetical protein